MTLQATDLVLHHLNNSRSQRILWLLEELNLEYKLIRYERDERTNLAPDTLKAAHPLGRAPILSTGNGVLVESGAIIDYLIRHYATETFQLPVAENARQDYQFWMHFAEASLMPPLVATLVMNKAQQQASPFFIKPLVNKVVTAIMQAYYGPNLRTSVDYVENHLANHPWFAGEAPSGADVQMIFALEAVLMGQSKEYPAIRAYVDKVHQRPAYIRALAIGGPYDYAS
jgi:glutathione S-transferase